MSLEKTVYYSKYTAGTYADALSSIPIWLGEKAAGLAELVLEDNAPEFLTTDYTRKNSRVYQFRERLRETLDTRPGAVFIQSNLIATIPFMALGMPAAEYAQDWINSSIPNAHAIVKNALDSAATLAVQMVVGYTTFMVNEIRTNPEKYREDGKLKTKKVAVGFGKAVKAFLTFDLTYIGAKLAGQTAFLALGKDPWKASAFADSIAVPLFYLIGIPIGLNKGIIEAKPKPKKPF